MLKKVLCLSVALLFTLALLAGCGGGASSSASQAGGASPSQTPAISSAPAAGPVIEEDIEPMELIVSSSKNEQADAALVNYLSRVTERTGGKITFTYYWSSSLVTVPEIPQALRSGVCDISQMNVVMYKSMLPLNATVLALPFMGMTDDTIGVYGQLYEEYPELAAEFESIGVQMLSYSMTRPYNLHLVGNNTTVTAPGDLRGFKIANDREEVMKILQENGAAPVAVGFAEFYSSLEKGVVDGILNHAAAVFTSGLVPLTKQNVIFGQDSGMYVDLVAYSMRADTWNALPASVQQIFVEEAEQFKADDFNVMLNFENRLEEEAIAQGNTYTVLTDEELDPWREQAAPIVEARLAALEGEGYTTVRDIYTRALELIEEYKA